MSTSAASRFNQSAPYGFSLLDGKRVATSWADLTDGSILNTISLTEQWTDIGVIGVYSNTATDGSVRSTMPSESCNNWTDGTAGGGKIALLGRSDLTDSFWTAAGFGPSCDFPRPIFCFEQ